MRIAINGLAAKVGGGVTYLQNLTNTIIEESKHEVYLFISSDAIDEFDLDTNTGQLTVETIDTSGVIERIRREQITIPMKIRRREIDLLYSPSEIPILWCPCKQVVANQNANLYYDLDDKKPFSQQFREWVLTHALQLSQSFTESILFMTESSKQKAIRELHIDDSTACAIHHGVEPAFADLSINNSTTIPIDEEYILLVSTIYKHKNIHNLVRGYALLSQETRNKHPLVIVGDKTAEPDYTQKVKNLVSQLEISKDVRFVGRMSKQEVLGYYKNAYLFVFPSLVESFGLPVLEAMASGVPVVASANAAIPEVGGEAALYFDPEDPDQMSVIMERALEDQELRDDLVTRGRQRAKKFTWEECAKETLNIFENATSCE